MNEPLGNRADPSLRGRGRRLAGEVLALWLVTLLAIRAVVAIQGGLGLPDWILALVPLLFIYAPVGLCSLRKVDSYAYRLSIPAFRDGKAWWEAVKLSLIVSLVVVLPWLVGYHFYQTLIFDHVPRMRFPPDLATLVAYQIFFVAIPEEFFYRGYLQTRLNEYFGRPFLVFGTPMGWGAPLACLMFAFGHSLVEFQWWHFATFFPGMVFAWMRERSEGVVAGAFFHAACNVSVITLDTLYGVR